MGLEYHAVAGGDPLEVCCSCSGDRVGCRLGQPLGPAAAPEAEKWEACGREGKHVKAQPAEPATELGRMAQVSVRAKRKLPRPPFWFSLCRRKKRRKNDWQANVTSPSPTQHWLWLTDSCPAYGQFMLLDCLWLLIGSGAKAWRRHLSTLTLPRLMVILFGFFLIVIFPRPDVLMRCHGSPCCQCQSLDHWPNGVCDWFNHAMNDQQ